MTSRLSFTLRTMAWVVLAALMSIVNLVFSATGEGDITGYLALSFLGTVSVPFVLIWRRRSPGVVMGITLVACTLLTIGATTAWVALGSLYRRRHLPLLKDPWLWAATAATTAVTYLAVIRDTSAEDPEHSLVGIMLEAPGDAWRGDLPWYTELLTTAILMAVVGGIIALTRTKTRLGQVEATAEDARAANLHLSEALARSEERERIARELHDSLGSKLAAVSTLSGAVRAQAHDAAAVASHAEHLQLTAQEATAQMHQIVRTYRNHEAPRTTLGDIEDLIETCLRRGMIIRSDLRLDTSTPAPPALERAAYRVVQELTTNAAKHAPGHMLTLGVWGSQAEGGIHIHAANPIPPTGPAPPSGGGSGIIGAAERVEQLGGWLHTSTAGDEFAVRVWIPWRAHPTR